MVKLVDDDGNSVVLVDDGGVHVRELCEGERKVNEFEKAWSLEGYAI